MSGTQHKNWVAFGAAALALLLVIVTVFVEWGAFDMEVQFSGGGWFDGGSTSGNMAYTLLQLEDTSWFDNDMDDVNGAGQVRTGAVLYLVGGAIALGGTAVLAIPPRVISRSVMAGAALCLAGAIVAGLGALLHHLGAAQIAEALTSSNSGSSSSASLALGTGLIMAYVGAAVLLAAAIVGFAWQPTATTRATA